jgi:hypothetical protein
MLMPTCFFSLSLPLSFYPPLSPYQTVIVFVDVTTLAVTAMTITMAITIITWFTQRDSGCKLPGPLVGYQGRTLPLK